MTDLEWFVNRSMNVWYAAVMSGSGRASRRSGANTFQKSLYLGQLGSIIQFSEVLGLLSQVLPLDSRIPLVCHDLGRRIVEAGDQGGHVDIYRMKQSAMRSSLPRRCVVSSTYSSMLRWRPETCWSCPELRQLQAPRELDRSLARPLLPCCSHEIHGGQVVSLGAGAHDSTRGSQCGLEHRRLNAGPG